MVFVRYVLNHTTIWQTDFVTYSIVAATFIGSPYVLMTRGHVNVDVLPLTSARARAGGSRLFTDPDGARLLHRAAVLAASSGTRPGRENWLSDTMWRARLWIPYLSMPIGLGLLVLQYVADLICLVTGREAAVRHRPRRVTARMSPTTQGLLVLVVDAG